MQRTSLWYRQAWRPSRRRGHQRRSSRRSRLNPIRRCHFRRPAHRRSRPTVGSCSSFQDQHSVGSSALGLRGQGSTDCSEGDRLTHPHQSDVGHFSYCYLYNKRCWSKVVPFINEMYCIATILITSPPTGTRVRPMTSAGVTAAPRPSATPGGRAPERIPATVSSRDVPGCGCAVAARTRGQRPTPFVQTVVAASRTDRHWTSVATSPTICGV